VKSRIEEVLGLNEIFHLSLVFIVPDYTCIFMDFPLDE